MTIDERLTIQLAKDSTSPEISYPGIHDLLESRQKFTAILSFNDISAMGSIRALHDYGLACRMIFRLWALMTFSPLRTMCRV